MLSWRLHTGAEKAELQELNARLYDYVCRVRELERENQLLEEELCRRCAQEDLWVQGQARYAEEARGLRQQLEELSWTTERAESECEVLRRELRELQQLGAEARAARGRLDAELGARQRELQEALSAQAALEALLGRLEAERQGLDAAHERDVRELRSRAASLTMHYRARLSGPAAPPPGLRQVHDSFALLAAESWQETVQLYEDEVHELEEALRRGQESRREAEEEARLCAQEAEALGRQVLELEQLRARLEDELLRRQEEYGLQAEEHQRVIDCLEDEKAALTLAMADRLRDYQDLVQVKTGLSLEVATYRALLEGESNPEILIWTKHVESALPELKSTTYRYTDSLVQRENERNLFARQKVALDSHLPGHLRPKTTSLSTGTAGRGPVGSGYSSTATTQREYSYGKTVEGQNGFGLFRGTSARVKTLPDRPKPEGASDAPTYLAKGSTSILESHWERRDNVVARGSDGAGPKDRAILVGKKTETKAAGEQERSRLGAIRPQPVEKMFDSKEKASEERNLRWEELTKLDKEARERESQQMTEKAGARESSKGSSMRAREVSINLQESPAVRPEASPKGLPGTKEAEGSASGEVGTREPGLRLGPGDARSSPHGGSSTETVAQNIVTSILKQFTQAPDAEPSTQALPDTKVTYLDRKELPGAGRTKTEIVVESRLTQAVDVSDEAGLETLLGQGAGDDVSLQGKSAERLIGDIIDLGLKGRGGRAKVLNVEIVEEPVGYTGERKVGEPPTPFRVEEVDDVIPGPQVLVEEEEGDADGDVMFSTHGRQNRTRVEEVTESGDSEGEQSYFVSTPDEQPGAQDEDEGSVYGQIHIEEQSSIRYSWQDEIAQGTRRRRQRDEAGGEKVVQALDVPVATSEGDVASVHWREQASGELRVEPTVIEKEIRIPQEFRTSIQGVVSKEPRDQMAEVIGQLEETLPARMREELSALTREGPGEPGGVSVDVTKLRASNGGSVTLLAKVNLSQTVDADQLDLEELSRDDAGEIEKAVESVVRQSLAGHRGRAPGSPEADDGTEAPAASFRFKRWATRELYSASEDGADAGPGLPASPGPVSATVEVSSPTGLAQSPVLEDVNLSMRRVQLGPGGIWRTESASGAEAAAGAGEVSVEGGLGPSQAGTSRSVRHVTLGSQQSQVFQEVVFHSPSPAWQQAVGTEEPGPAELPGDMDGLNQQFRAEKEVTVQGPGARAGAGEEGIQTSVRHLQLAPKEGPLGPIEFTVPFSEHSGLSLQGDSEHPQEEGLGVSTAMRHIRLGPQTREQVVFQGLGPGSEELSDSESVVHREVRVTEKSIFHGMVDGEGDTEGVGETTSLSRSFRHIQLGPTEAQGLGHLVVHAPVTKTFALVGSAGAPEPGQAADGRPVAQGPTETSFTFQMAVSDVEAGTEARGAWTDAGGEKGEERAGLDRTVQLQRMVDQRSVVSDEKKVALLYLDNEEEDGDGHWF